MEDLYRHKPGMRKKMRYGNIEERYNKKAKKYSLSAHLWHFDGTQMAYAINKTSLNGFTQSARRVV